MAQAMARSRAAEKSPAAQARRIPALDGWRLVAVTLVILSHLVEYSTLRTHIPASLSFRFLEHPLIGVGAQISRALKSRGMAHKPQRLRARRTA